MFEKHFISFISWNNTTSPLHLIQQKLLLKKRKKKISLIKGLIRAYAGPELEESIESLRERGVFLWDAGFFYF